MSDNRYPLDCLHGSFNIIVDGKGKPYFCNKLDRSIYPKDCSNCGYFYAVQVAETYRKMREGLDSKVVNDNKDKDVTKKL